MAGRLVSQENKFSDDWYVSIGLMAYRLRHYYKYYCYFQVQYKKVR